MGGWGDGGERSVSSAAKSYQHIRFDFNSHDDACDPPFLLPFPFSPIPPTLSGKCGETNISTDRGTQHRFFGGMSTDHFDSTSVPKMVRVFIVA